MVYTVFITIFVKLITFYVWGYLMNTKTISNINRFGKAGKVVMTILLIAGIMVTLLSGVATVYASTFPKDAVKVTVTNRAVFEVRENSFSSVWSMLTNGFSYAADSDPSDALKDNDSKVLPPENTKISTDLNFFDQSYSSATIRSEGTKKFVEAESNPAEYRSSDLVVLLVFATLFFASVAVALLMLQKLFKVLSVCASPFCADLVSGLRAFGYSLLPVALFASIGETLAVRFLSAGKNAGISVQWGMLITFAVTMFLVTVFRYGVQLQKESDETL